MGGGVSGSRGGNGAGAGTVKGGRGRVWVGAVWGAGWGLGQGLVRGQVTGAGGNHETSANKTWAEYSNLEIPM
jgi:hypothetical protein